MPIYAKEEKKADMKQMPMLNRELSWLDYNARVLAEGLKPSTPLLEQLRFISIFASNLDEFFMVRVAAVKAAMAQGSTSEEWAGMEPSTLRTMIHEKVQSQYQILYRHLHEHLIPQLAAHGIHLLPRTKWQNRDMRFLEKHFMEQVYPLLTPLRLEGGIFPATGSLQVHVAFRLAREPQATDQPAEETFAIVQVPRNIERIVVLPIESPASEAGTPHCRLALLEDLVTAFGSRLFPGYRVLRSAVFKVNRDADFAVDEDRDDDFLTAMEEVLAGRQNSTPVRIVFGKADHFIEEALKQSLSLDDTDVYHIEWPIDIGRLQTLYDPEFYHAQGIPLDPALLFREWKPIRSLPSGTSIFDWIEAHDRFVNVPYESFDAVQRFIEESADDPQVLGIKITLYRTSGMNSPIVHALAKAARAGKQVVVVIELKARFDEEKNISWAGALEQAGAIVTFGVAHLKVHAKAALIIRRRPDGGIRRYVHLSTGNYNERTARSYVDFCLFSANEQICTDIALFFNILTGYSSIQALSVTAIAPFDLKKRIIGLIEREITQSTVESPGLIIAKVNALSDADIVRALYRASSAGVRIFLNVRGVCALVPGLPGLSETIEVRSVLGRYLEHGRILYFRNGGSEEIYLSSADWLQRNMEKRIELLFPVFDAGIKGRIKEILETYFQDTSHAYELLPSGEWIQAARPLSIFSAPRTDRQEEGAQERLYRLSRKAVRTTEEKMEVLQVRRISARTVSRAKTHSPKEDTP
mgnify:CR=1 FL=1